MNESILKALIQLFAIIANVKEDSVSEKSRTIVEAYLSQELSASQLAEYLQLFDEYLASHHGNISNKGVSKERKRTSANSVKVLRICEQINEELQQKEKIVVTLRLLEYIKAGEVVTEKELDFAKTVADIFNIEAAEYMNMKIFILDSSYEIPTKENILIVHSNKKFNDSEIKQIQSPNLNGYITILKIESTSTYVFRYNGTDSLYHNSRSLQEDAIYFFDKGSSIRSSKINPIYYSDVAGKFLHDHIKSRIVFEAKDVEFKFKNSENGIHKFNLKEESGQLIGIMGGSGVGKSTLLNVLNGNIPIDNGSILINGLDIKNNKEHLEGIIGYVPQDDLLMEELTVLQNLYYNAKLCFKHFSEMQIKKTVLRLLIDLDLNDIRNLTVGTPLNKFISGGQRKRLNIALELIREPAILFVDEPTSGLSSMDSDMVMDLLKEQTLKGKLVFVNIHQPSSEIFKLFDKMMIMDKGGRPVYYGNPIDAIVYFKKLTHHANVEESTCTCCGNVNPEQILQILEAKVVNEYGKLTRKRKVSPEEWYQRYLDNIEAKNLEIAQKKEIPTDLNLPKNYFSIPGKFKQFKIFIIRDVLSKFTNRQYLLINFLESPLLAIILAFFTKYLIGSPSNPDAYIFSENENIPAYIFMAVVVALFIGMSVSAEEIIKDRKIIQRESFLNLSRFSYLNSKVLIMFALSAIQTLTFVLIGNFILEIKGMNLSYWLVLFTTSCFANILGLNISASLNSVVTIYILIPFILVPQLLLSGTIVKFEKLHKSLASPYYVPVVGDIMTSRWAYEALTVNQFKNNKYQKYFFEIERQRSYAGFAKNYLISELQSKLNACETNMNNSDVYENLKSDLKTIRNEIKVFNTQIPQIKFNYTDSLTIEKISKQTLVMTNKYLETLKRFYSKKYDEANQQLDLKFEELLKTMSKDEIVELKENYHNENLSDLVLNNAEIKKIKEYDNRLIQLSEPIYRYPESNFGRAHFYAPVKQIFNVKIDTFWFNIMIIWLTTIFFYFTLLFDSLKKAGNFIRSFKLFKFRRKNIIE